MEFIKSQPERAYNLIGTVKDFNIPSDLAKTMLGRREARGLRRQSLIHGHGGSNPDYDNILSMAQDMYRELRIIKHTFNPEDSLDRRYVEKLAEQFLHGIERGADRIQGARERRDADCDATSVDLLRPELFQDESGFAGHRG